MSYLESVTISKEKVDKIRKLLEIESFENMTCNEMEEIGAKIDDFEYIFSVEFEDGAKLDWRLCSGSSNYFDDVIFTYPDGVYTDLDCIYELDNIEIDAGNAVYCVELDIR